MAVKEILHEYLQTARDAVVWKLDGLTEYDVRRPLVSTGTNLLGLVKHLTCGELGYFQTVFDRSSDQANPWFDENVEGNADMFARADESREDIVAGYRRACSSADETIEALDLDSPGKVPWWGNQPVTLGRILVHVTTETCRHAGHADVVRELLDGQVGYATWDSNVPDHDTAWWHSYRDRVEQEARRAAG
ncbi:MAG: DinB family protein [Acidimicrobiaceae bacterium]|nr:DinB family protein [Acidimicrobiaceae bacterium]